MSLLGYRKQTKFDSSEFDKLKIEINKIKKDIDETNKNSDDEKFNKLKKEIDKTNEKVKKISDLVDLNINKLSPGIKEPCWILNYILKNNTIKYEIDGGNIYLKELINQGAGLQNYVPQRKYFRIITFDNINCMMMMQREPDDDVAFFQGSGLNVGVFIIVGYYKLDKSKKELDIKNYQKFIFIERFNSAFKHLGEAMYLEKIKRNKKFYKENGTEIKELEMFKIAYMEGRIVIFPSEKEKEVLISTFKTLPVEDKQKYTDTDLIKIVS